MKYLVFMDSEKEMQEKICPRCGSISYSQDQILCCYPKEEKTKNRISSKKKNIEMKSKDSKISH